MSLGCVNDCTTCTWRSLRIGSIMPHNASPWHGSSASRPWGLIASTPTCFDSDWRSCPPPAKHRLKSSMPQAASYAAAALTCSIADSPKSAFDGSCRCLRMNHCLRVTLTCTCSRHTTYPRLRRWLTSSKCETLKVDSLLVDHHMPRH